MKSIPSLVAASTVGVAAAGLAFGRPQAPYTDRPTSKKRKATEYEGGKRHTSSNSRPATSSTMRTPNREQPADFSPWSSEPSAGGSAQHGIHTPNATGGTANEFETTRVGRRGRLMRRETLPSRSPAAEERMDSVSSRGSWYKRLSIIQPSQQSGSPRSSIGPDSPQLTLSNGSVAPMLPLSSSPVQLPPNKLVKRTTSGRISGGDTSGNVSRSRVPTLRRPATSHQRSVTLQQQFIKHEDEVRHTIPEHNSSPARLPSFADQTTFPQDSRVYWRHHFDSRSSKLTKDRPSDRFTDENSQEFSSTSRRVLLPEEPFPPTLIKPGMILNTESDGSFIAVEFGTDESDLFSAEDCTPKSDEIDKETRKRPKRSLSMQFSSPSTWISRSSSLRASKRGATEKKSGRRYASAPLASLPGRAVVTSYAPTNPQRRIDITDPGIYQRQTAETQDEEESHILFSSSTSRSRNMSSPLPPLSRLSSFNLDLARMGLSSSSSSDPRQTPHSPHFPKSTPSSPQIGANQRPQGKSSPKVIVHQSRSPRVTSMAASDRASTLIGSDNEIRDFASGEEDEMDFQSDTVFDSFRTGHTGSMRVRSPALETMFDTSPPSAGLKAKSLAIDDLVSSAGFNDRTDRIMEEDEGMSTPIKSRRASAEDLFNTPTRKTAGQDDAIRSSPPSFCLATKNFGRLSLEDDEDDEDWARDDDSVELTNSLSPPNSSINSQRINPAIRLALADLTKSGSSPGNTVPGEDRPKSVFDWSEPLMSEKFDALGNSPRPRTVHGKQGIDGRGGRVVGRRGPSALHIRSQSVPVVPDVNGHREHTKMAPKFGTWGLGAKGVSEDWDNDFEFDGMDFEDNENGHQSMSNSMLVPPAIQASQANVVGHVGQIREVCLLVEDLKRLRGLAKEKGLLNGSSAGLWREAEGIIALAIPDEDDATLSPPQSPSSPILKPHDISDEDLDPEFEVTGSPRPEIFDHIIKAPIDLRDLQGRRRSVFSPEDDIFGTGSIVEAEEDRLHPANEPRSGNKQTMDVARSVMEHIHQHRVASDPLRTDNVATPSTKMPFDTTSLRDLVQRASTLSRMLAELIRKVDNADQSPIRTPLQGRDRDSSPAFTRVFTDPLASPSKHLSRSQSNNSILNGTIDSSPSRNLGQRMHMMTVV